MAELDAPAPTGGRGGGPTKDVKAFLTAKHLGLPGWAWAIAAGVGAGLIYFQFFAKKSPAAQVTAPTDPSAQLGLSPQALSGNYANSPSVISPTPASQAPGPAFNAPFIATVIQGAQWWDKPGGQAWGNIGSTVSLVADPNNPGWYMINDAAIARQNKGPGWFPASQVIGGSPSPIAAGTGGPDLPKQASMMGWVGTTSGTPVALLGQGGGSEGGSSGGTTVPQSIRRARSQTRRVPYQKKAVGGSEGLGGDFAGVGGAKAASGRITRALRGLRGRR